VIDRFGRDLRHLQPLFLRDADKCCWAKYSQILPVLLICCIFMAINTIYPIYSTRFGLSFLHDYREEEHDSGLVLLAKQRNVHPYQYLAK